MRTLWDFPEYWEDLERLITGEENLIEKDVKKDSDEWEEVEQRFKVTMKGSNIT